MLVLSLIHSAMSQTPVRAGADRLRSLLDEGRRPLVTRVEAVGEDTVRRAEVGFSLGRAHAEVMDQILITAFEAALEQTAERGEGIALAGVGGYGRGAVALGSDLDVRLLTRDLDRAAAVADALLYPLWDSGLTIEAGLRARRALVEAKKAEQRPNVYVGIVGSAGRSTCSSPTSRTAPGPCAISIRLVGRLAHAGTSAISTSWCGSASW